MYISGDDITEPNLSSNQPTLIFIKMSSAPGLVGYSQDPSGTPGQSEEAAAKEEFESIKPRAEERSSDARKNTPKSAKDAEYGPNQRSEAFKRGEKIGIDIESENSAEGVVRDSSRAR